MLVLLAKVRSACIFHSLKNSKMNRNALFLSAFLFVVIAISSSCFKLDSNLFNSKKIEVYQRDAYTGEQDFVLDNTYTIDDALIHEMTFTYNSPSTGASNTIYAVYLGDESRIQTDTVIVYCHGNRWNMDFYWQRAKLLANVGAKNRYGVLMMDYRGYGRSAGLPSEEGLYEDVDQCLQWLKSQGLSNDRFVMYGFSMGTAPATKLTAEPRSMIPSKLILEAPFASAETMVQDASKLAMPGSFFTNLKIDNAAEIKLVNQPFLWIHGIDDDYLNIKTHGEVVYKNYKGVRGTAVRVPGAGHSTVQTVMGFQAYSDTLLHFISR